MSRRHGGVVSVFSIIWSPHRAKYLTLPYAFCKGITLTTLTFFADLRYPGIASQVVMATFGVFLLLILVRYNQWFTLNRQFRTLLMTCLLSLLLLYFANAFLYLLGFNNKWLRNIIVERTGLLGIGFSWFVVGLASFVLLSDIQNIETAAKNNLPKQFEWYCAFSLMASLLWLYLQILRLLFSQKEQ